MNLKITRKENDRIITELIKDVKYFEFFLDGNFACLTVWYNSYKKLLVGDYTIPNIIYFENTNSEQI